MIEADARARLERMVAHDRDPALTSAEVDDLVALAKRQDAYGVDADDASWTPTWDLNAAAAEGWRWKAGKAAERADVSGTGDSISRSQVYAHCVEQATYYASRVVAAPRSPGGLAVDAGWQPVIGNQEV